MNFNNVSTSLTVDGDLKLQGAELDLLRELNDAGDRGGFHYVYAEMADNGDSRLTAKIATFTDMVGGTAFGANWRLQQTVDDYPGIYFLSQEITNMFLREFS